jgi:hypothetical protein
MLTKDFIFVAGNVLLLRNILKLSLDTVEIGSSKLLALVAERLLDSNSNMQVSSGSWQILKSTHNDQRIVPILYGLCRTD